MNLKLKKTITKEEADLIIEEITQEITVSITDKFPQFTGFSPEEKLVLQLSGIMTMKILKKLDLITIER